MYDVVVIGGGPAGMTAALYVKRMGKSVLVLEGEAFGGQIASSPKVENYPGIKTLSGNLFADNLLDQVLSLGAQVELENVKGFVKTCIGFEVLTEYNKYCCKSVIIASGCRHRQLDIAGKYPDIKSGISYCAVCDGIFYRDRAVAVIGGGDTALQNALYLSSMCQKVYVVHRRNAFRGSETLAASLKNRDNVEICFNSTVTKLYGKNALEGIEITDTQNGTLRNIDLQGLFISIGQIPATDIFREMIEIDKDGYIISGEDCRTSLEGVFAAGDCRVKEVNQLATAIADGAVSAINACRYVDT